MKIMNAGLKIFLFTVGTLLVLALAALLIWLAGGGAPQYETVDASYEPVTQTAAPTAAPELSESLATPEPTATPAPAPESQSESNAE